MQNLRVFEDTGKNLYPQMIILGYKASALKGAWGIDDITNEVSYYAEKRCYDEIYDFVYTREAVEDFLLATKNFFIDEKPFNECQNNLIPMFGNDTILLSAKNETV